MDFDLILQDFNSSMANIRKLKQYVSGQISHYDTMQSEFYHLFENAKLPASKRSQLDKKFDECLKQRRMFKMQKAKLDSMDTIVKQNGLNTSIGYNKCGNGTFKPTILIDEFKECEKFLK